MLIWVNGSTTSETSRFCSLISVIEQEQKFEGNKINVGYTERDSREVFGTTKVTRYSKWIKANTVLYFTHTQWEDCEASIERVNRLTDINSNKLIHHNFVNWIFWRGGDFGSSEENNIVEIKTSLIFHQHNILGTN